MYEIDKPCWHCNGSGGCTCIVCAADVVYPLTVGDCVVCNGTGKMASTEEKVT